MARRRADYIPRGLPAGSPKGEAAMNVLPLERPKNRGLVTAPTRRFAVFSRGSLDVALQTDVIGCIPADLAAEEQVIHSRLVVGVVTGRALHPGLGC